MLWHFFGYIPNPKAMEWMIIRGKSCRNKQNYLDSFFVSRYFLIIWLFRTNEHIHTHCKVSSINSSGWCTYPFGGLNLYWLWCWCWRLRWLWNRNWNWNWTRFISVADCRRFCFAEFTNNFSPNTVVADGSVLRNRGDSLNNLCLFQRICLRTAAIVSVAWITKRN